MSTWTVVGNDTAARIFCSDKDADFRELRTFTNPANRQHGRDLKSDRYGRSQHGSGQSESYEEPDVRQHERERFAEMVAQHVSDAYRNKDFSRLYLVCSPRFLGELRKQLPQTVLHAVTLEIPRNIVTHSESDIRKHLPESI